MDPIRQLHQHNPNVTGHRHKHPPQIFGLCLGAVVEMNAAKFGDPLHQLSHFRAEMLLDLVERYIGVFDHIVEEARGDHRSTGSDIPQQISHGNGMNDVGVATRPELPLMQLKTEVESRHQQRFWIGRTTLASPWRHVGNALPQPLGQHNLIIVWISNRTLP